MFYKKLISFLLVLVTLSVTSYLPIFAPTPKAEAVFFLTTDIWQRAEGWLDRAAVAVANATMERVVRQTIQWAQSGFDGNPAYAVNPGQFLTNVADNAAGQFIAGSDLGFLCSPFQTKIRIALQRQYIQPLPFQCTLTRVVGNIDAFYNDFSQGGWEGWFGMTQNSANNPYGAFISAQGELARRLASQLGIEQQQLSQNRGFLSWRGECQATNPPQQVSTGIDPNTGLPQFDIDSGHVPGVEVGGCIKYGDIITPGSVIADQLNKTLPSGLDRLINAQTADQVVGAFLSGLLQRFVFSNTGGLFKPSSEGSDPNSRLQELIDIDGDDIWDGWDTNRDGNLDICHHGLKFNLPVGALPSNTNCFGSTEVINSPHFAGLCSALTEAANQTRSFLTFANNSVFTSPDSTNIWTTKIMSYQMGLENLINVFLELEIVPWLQHANNLSGWARLNQEHLEVLAEHKRLAYGAGDDSSANLLRTGAAMNLEWFINFRNDIISCDTPNINAGANVSSPVANLPSSGSGGSSGSGPLVWAWRDFGGPAYAPQPCSGVAGCVNGLLLDPQAYFFSVINRSPGQAANDWEAVLTASGIPPGVGPGQLPNMSVHFGITQQTGAGGVRGRLFLPTNQPDGLGYYSHPIDVLADAP